MGRKSSDQSQSKCGIAAPNVGLWAVTLSLFVLLVPNVAKAQIEFVSDTFECKEELAAQVQENFENRNIRLSDPAYIKNANVGGLEFDIVTGPAWLNIDSKSNILSGVPRVYEAGNNIECIIRAQDSSGASDQALFIIDVEPEVIEPDYFVSPDGDDDNSGTSAEAAWQTVSKACETVRAGQAVKILPGEYNENIRLANNGARGEPITLIGESMDSVKVRGKNENPDGGGIPICQLSGKQFIRIYNLNFDANDSCSWVSSDSETADIELVNCAFDQKNNPGQYIGLLMRGCERIVVKGCRFRQYSPGNSMDFIRCNGLVLEDCDLSQSHSGHGPMHLEGTRNAVVRRNYLRESWDRAASFVWRPGDGEGRDLTVEDNIFFDCLWEPGYSIPPFTDSYIGSGQTLKFGVRRGIFRNNIIAAASKGRPEEGDAVFNPDHNRGGGSVAGITFSYWEPATHQEFMRLYHNVIYDLKSHGMAIQGPHRLGRWPYHCEDNRVFNNVFGRILRADVFVIAPHVKISEYQFFNNLFGESIKYGDKVIRYRSEDATKGEYVTLERAHELAPDSFFDNRFAPDGAIRLANADKAIEIADGRMVDGKLVKPFDKYVYFSDFVMADDSAGKNSAIPLTIVAKSGEDTDTIQVGDAYPFCDGYNGLVDGDIIHIAHAGGGKSIRQVAEQVDGVTLKLRTAVTVAKGDEVFLAKFPPGSDPGVVDVKLTAIPARKTELLKKE